jgi:large subunit ribosomal protein L28
MLTGRGPMKINKISHSNRKVKQWRQPNTKNKRIWDEVQGRWIRLTLSTRAIRTIDKKGLLQSFKDEGLAG